MQEYYPATRYRLHSNCSIERYRIIVTGCWSAGSGGGGFLHESHHPKVGNLLECAVGIWTLHAKMK